LRAADRRGFSGFRPLETDGDRHWRRKADRVGDTRANQFRHNLAGSPGTEIMPGLIEDGDLVIDSRKRKDCFCATDLDFMLRALGGAGLRHALQTRGKP